MSKGIRRATLAGLLACAFPATARAACTITATPVAFGNYDVFAATPVDSTGSITISCTPAEVVQVTLSSGSSPTYTPRTLRNGANVLNYNLFRNGGRTQIFGDGTGGTSDFSGNVNTRTLNVFGRIPALQDVAVGPYSDTIVVTIIF